MLAIRMQRLGRKGHPTYRVVVQDVRQTPSSGKYVALLGSYDPHTKTSTLVKEKAAFYLSNGARPSDRVVNLLQAEGVALPAWIKHEKTIKTRTLRNPEKLRKNQPAVEKEAPGPAEEQSSDVEIAEAPASEIETVNETADTAESNSSVNEEDEKKEVTPQ